MAGATGLAGLVASLIGAPVAAPGEPVWLVRALVSSVVFMVVSLGFAGIATALQRGEPLGPTLARTYSGSWEPALAGVGAGGSLAVLLLTAPLSAFLFLALLPMLNRMHRSLENIGAPAGKGDNAHGECERQQDKIGVLHAQDERLSR